uniref:ABC transporter domain-containing protein n=1 Tax=Timema genevievae TaxID=629358 RepID=A0A7R9PSG4_TIMGE|nr:unnamed protein product [Timema genevievae]
MTIIIVEEVLESLFLKVCRDTRTERLSGGQRKRLSIALELVNNPPVVFIDEPTTGLDIVTVKKCITMLKSLARQGRTIICTIHQPTSTLLAEFDNVYVIARGQCVYQGDSSQIVPFLGRMGLNCPTTYNPADYS